MLTFQVTGMTCAHCVAAITRAVRRLPSVRDVQVDLDRGQVRVDGTPDVASVRAVIREEGYEVAE
jgi:copper chaperone